MRMANKLVLINSSCLYRIVSYCYGPRLVLRAALSAKPFFVVDVISRFMGELENCLADFDEIAAIGFAIADLV